MSVGIERIALTDDAHIDDAIDAECQSADGENQTDYAQYCRIRYVWPGPSWHKPHQSGNANHKDKQSQQIAEYVRFVHLIGMRLSISSMMIRGFFTTFLMKHSLGRFGLGNTSLGFGLFISQF